MQKVIKISFYIALAAALSIVLSSLLHRAGASETLALLAAAPGVLGVFCTPITFFIGLKGLFERRKYDKTFLYYCIATIILSLGHVMLLGQTGA